MTRLFLLELGWVTWQPTHTTTLYIPCCRNTGTAEARLTNKYGIVDPAVRYFGME